MTDQFLSAIGAVSVEFAVLEQQVHLAIWSFLVGTSLADQERGRLVTASRSFGNNVDLLFSLIRNRAPDPMHERLNVLRGRLSEAETERNMIVHSTWARADEGDAIRIKTTARGNILFHRLTADDIRSRAAGIHALAEEVLNLHLALLQPDAPKVTL